MLTKVKGLLAPPSFEDDEDKTRVAGLLNITLLSLFVIGGTFLSISTLIRGSYPGVLAIFGTVTILVPGLWFVARRGHIRLASVLLTSLIFLAVFGGVCVVGSIRAPIASGFIASVVIASVLTGHRGTIVYTVLSLAALLGLWWAESAGLLVPFAHERAGFAAWVTLAATLLSIAMLLILATRGLNEALGRARRGERALAQSNRRLRVEIAERVRAEEALQRKAKQLSSLNEIARAVSALLDIEGTLEVIFQQVRRSLPLDAFFICLYNAESNRVSYPLMYDDGQYFLADDDILAPDSSLARTFKTATPQLINRSAEELAALERPVYSIGDESKTSASLLYAPLQVGQQVIGAISAQSYSVNAYDQEHLALLTGVANQAAIAIENARLYDEVQRYAAELETRVAERTVELATVNKELEAFAYSVSHDLRAPLRAMDGFSRILLEDYAPQLPADARHHLGRVRHNAQRMGKLIEDLLAFSRLGRQALRKQTVWPKGLVEQVLEDLRAEKRERQVTVIIDDLPACQADPALLRQIYANLLSNAFKFTLTRDDPRIEVGCLPEDEGQVYYVRDNGVGFDMRYVDKLFGVFQRLHSAQEYEGTGIGLATVQRIVHRHGGQVWAEAAVGKGATFYFTLPEASAGPESLEGTAT